MSRIVLGSLVTAAWVAFSASVAHAGWDSKGRPYPVETQSAAPAQSGSGTSQAAVTQLEKREARVDQLMQGKTGAAEYSELVKQKRQLQELIDRMRAGQSVDPSEIDRLMYAAPQ